MKQKKILLMLLILQLCCVLTAQSFYVKPYIRCHQSISTQTEPDFYFVLFDLPVSPGLHITSGTNSVSEDFTIASGLKPGFAVGYTFKNNLGVELGVNYFNKQKVFTGIDKPILTSDWTYQATTFSPAFTFTIDNKKSSFTGKAGLVLALTNAKQSTSDKNFKYADCTFNTNMNLGFTAGIEYDYQLSKSFALATELGLEAYNYTPKKSKVQYENVYDYSFDESGRPISSKKILEIKYANKITNEKTDDFRFSSARFKKTIFFNSLYFGIGIKYTIGGHK
jgi:hypothetical protein